MSAGRTSERSLRHKTIKIYDDDEVEDEIDGKRTFDVMEKIKSYKYDAECVLELHSEDFSFCYIQRNGFYSPIRFKEKEHLGLRVPDSEKFGVMDIQTYVGAKRILDVMECVTQRAMEMTMKDFAQYFESNERKRIYNVISLEFSQTKLSPLVKRPSVVDKMDWIDLAWPPHLKCEQSEQTNKMSNMKYPKVQKYCLMSVGGCYTDFHVDFGGTSVWYHILKGEKIFWLIPPTSKNLDIYERWTMSGKQGEIFFGDIVDRCQRIHLNTGDSLMIPSGWIHAVYTPVDSIVFGGNFLHSFNIPMQLRVAQLEERLHVPARFRFPYFQEVFWYTVERYVCSMTGQSFLTEEYQKRSMLIIKQTDGSMDEIKEENDVANAKKDVHLTPYELKGLQHLVESLGSLPKSKKFIPCGIENPFGLLTAAKQMIMDHSGDDPEMAVTGEAIPCWPKPLSNLKRSHSDDVKIIRRSTSASSTRVRRVRCKLCDACLRGDCGGCVYCKDMKKFGGPGTMKQSCLLRRCTNPLLPSTKRLEGGTPIMDTIAVPAGVPDVEPEEEDELPSMKKVKLSRYRSPESGPLKTPKMDKVKISKDQSPLVPRVTVPRLRRSELMKYPIRPADNEISTSMDQITEDATSDKDAWMQVFKRLSQQDLCCCMRVCKAFLRWCSSPIFWKTLDLSESLISAEALQCIVRRQPKSINLTRSYVSSDQLGWLIKRCPSLRNLNLTGNSWPLVAVLSSASCPQLHSLNLSWVSGLTDSLLKQLVMPPGDARPGQQVPHTRLRFLRHLSLNGTDTTNAGVSLLPPELPHLQSVDLSYCSVSDKAIKCLVAAANDKHCPDLNTIIARSCPDITHKSLKHISEFRNLSTVDFSDCCQITQKDCSDILLKHVTKQLKLIEVGLLVADQ